MSNILAKVVSWAKGVVLFNERGQENGSEAYSMVGFEPSREAGCHDKGVKEMVIKGKRKPLAKRKGNALFKALKTEAKRLKAEGEETNEGAQTEAAQGKDEAVTDQELVKEPEPERSGVIRMPRIIPAKLKIAKTGKKPSRRPTPSQANPIRISPKPIRISPKPLKLPRA